ncbi:MAG TPA: HNH endonuclease signature motif containing protein [Acidimicrobiia bacterium]
MARIVRSRDKGCRFPQCGRTVWLHIHHIIHWANGGPTSLENLITLCGFHHRLIHNEGRSIRGNPNGEVTWITRWGTKFERHPIFPGIQYIKEFHSGPRTIERPPRQVSGSIDYSTQPLERSA